MKTFGTKTDVGRRRHRIFFHTRITVTSLNSSAISQYGRSHPGQGDADAAFKRYLSELILNYNGFLICYHKKSQGFFHSLPRFNDGPARHIHLVALKAVSSPVFSDLWRIFIIRHGCSTRTALAACMPKWLICPEVILWSYWLRNWDRAAYSRGLQSGGVIVRRN